MPALAPPTRPDHRDPAGPRSRGVAPRPALRRDDRHAGAAAPRARPAQPEPAVGRGRDHDRAREHDLVPDRQVEDAMARADAAQRRQPHLPRLGFGGQRRPHRAIDGAMPRPEAGDDRARPRLEHAFELDRAGPAAGVPEVRRASVDARRAPRRPQAALLRLPWHVVVGDDAPGRGPQRMQVAAASDAGPGVAGERDGRLRPVGGDGLAVDREVDAVETLARHDGPDDRAIERRLEPQAAHLARRQLAHGEGERPIAHQLRDDRLAVVLAADDEALADHARPATSPRRRLRRRRRRRW